MRIRPTALPSGFAALAACSLSAACTAGASDATSALEKSLRHEIARGGTQVVAHRGSSAEYPENTMVAFRAAIEEGADLVELDYYTSADGVAFCFHDETLDRTTDAASRLGEGVEASRLSIEELRELDAGSWKAKRFAGERIPTLRRVVEELSSRTVLLIEHKRGDPDGIVELLRRAGATRNVIVQSFDWDFVAGVHERDPSILLGALGDGALDERRLDEIERAGARIVHWRAGDVDPELVRRVADRGMLLFAYTVNDPMTMAGAIALRLDGLTTDRPARMIEVKRALR